MSYITALILSQLTWDLSLVYHNTFLLQVAKAAGKDLGQEILEHFKVRMAPSIVVLQAAGHTPTGSQCTTPSSCGVPARPVKSLDEFGEELLVCCQGLHHYDVSVIIVVNASMHGYLHSLYFHRYGPS